MPRSLHPGGWKETINGSSGVNLTYINRWGAIPVKNDEVIKGLKWCFEPDRHPVCLLHAFVRYMEHHYEPIWRILREMCFDLLPPNAPKKLSAVVWPSARGLEQWLPKVHPPPIWETRSIRTVVADELRLPFLGPELNLRRTPPGKIVVPEGVKALAAESFSYGDAYEVELPSTLVRIKHGAFRWNRRLQRVTFKSTIVRIEPSTFFHNPKVELVLPLNANPGMHCAARRALGPESPSADLPESAAEVFELSGLY